MHLETPGAFLFFMESAYAAMTDAGTVFRQTLKKVS